MTETIADLANRRIESGVEPPSHHLNEAAEAIDAPNPMTEALEPAATPHPCAVAMDLEAPKTSHEAAPTPAKLPPKARHDISRRCRRDVDAGGGGPSAPSKARQRFDRTSTMERELGAASSNSHDQAHRTRHRVTNECPFLANVRRAQVFTRGNTNARTPLRGAQYGGPSPARLFST